MLVGIWKLSLLFSCVAVFTVPLLICVRLIDAKVKAERIDRRQVLLRECLAWLEDDSRKAVFLKMVHSDPIVAMPLFVELLELLRGAQSKRLAAVGEQTGLARSQRRLLGNRSSAKRRLGAENLAWFPSDPTVGALFEALDDDVAVVRLAAAQSLAVLRETVPLKKILRQGHAISCDQSELLFLFFSKIATSQRADLLEILHTRAYSDRVRLTAIAALALSGDHRLVETISRHYTDESKSIRAAVAKGLGVLGNPDCEIAIRQLLQDPIWIVRAEAAKSAGRLGLVDLTPPLLHLIIDESAIVQTRTIEALKGFGVSGRIALDKLVLDANPWQSRAAELALLLQERA